MIRLKDMIIRNLFTESKKFRVFDFDDTLVKTTSFIYVTNNGKKKINTDVNMVYNEKPVMMNLISLISQKFRIQTKSKK